ncbi:hypothetical protein CARUB_v10011001mg [Capsella rubella]|uniref:Knottin scorpion toxin-like domain-containing protein n=1 Tax=Capsella rubella TaxID=81985 RepID=R0IG43_9BRAS|nr:defensin-like protein 275 [Capsella rubella]EOA37320.1 hypothetical protein CARUB_v10011001mg [Capsella rubella]
MALSKFQLATLLIAYFLLTSSHQSKILNTNQIGVEECVYRGLCRSSKECKSRCGPPEFSQDTVGLCMLDYDDYEYRCCCIVDNKK